MLRLHISSTPTWNGLQVTPFATSLPTPTGNENATNDSEFVRSPPRGGTSEVPQSARQLVQKQGTAKRRELSVGKEAEGLTEQELLIC